MDNISFEIIWKDINMTEIKAIIKNSFIYANVAFYVQQEDIEIMISSNKKSQMANQRYIFFNLDGDEALLIQVKEINKFGHIILSVELNHIDDNDTRHKCVTFIKTDIGCYERFFDLLTKLVDSNVQNVLYLNPI